MNKNNTDDISLPVSVDKLIELLDKLYPERCPDKTDKVNDIYFKAGQRDVVRFLIYLQERDK